MTLNSSLKNRVRRLEVLAVEPRALVAGVLLRHGTSLASAVEQIGIAKRISDVVYIANLAGLRLPKE